MALVIKEWRASEKPDSNGVFVRISGREAGVVNFVLSLIGIDPTTSLTIDQSAIRVEEGSLAGFSRRVTPLGNLCSGGFGYAKPWKAAVAIGALGVVLGFVQSIAGAMVVVGAGVYYFLNKELQLLLIDVAGSVALKIEYKRSVIEGKNIDEKDGERVIQILANLLRPIAAGGVAPPTPVEVVVPANPVFCSECGARNMAKEANCKSCGAVLTAS